jgi:hypothetical protein
LSITDLQTIEIKDTRICSFDIINTYINTPKVDTTNININILKINPGINKNIQNERVHLVKTVMEKDYFQSELKYYKQMD